MFESSRWVWAWFPGHHFGMRRPAASRPPRRFMPSVAAQMHRACQLGEPPTLAAAAARRNRTPAFNDVCNSGTVAGTGAVLSESIQTIQTGF